MVSYLEQRWNLEDASPVIQRLLICAFDYLTNVHNRVH